MDKRYFVKQNGQWEEVDLAGWCRAESLAGFWSHGGPGTAATGGFSGRGIDGYMVYKGNNATDYQWNPEFAAFLRGLGL